MEIRRVRRGVAADAVPGAPFPFPAEGMQGTAPGCAPRGRVRALEDRDVARVAELHARILPRANPVSSPSLSAYLSRILVQHPWQSASLPSLVFEDGHGDVAGCLGVMPLPLWFQGRPVTAAVSHSFIVEPGSRAALAALELARAFLSGSQDLSMAEGGPASRRLWEHAGGRASLLYSLCWTRPLQPSRYVLSFLRKRGLSPAAGWALRPLCRLVDAVAPFAGRPFRLPAPAVSGAMLDAGTFSRSVDEFTRNRSLRPRYDERSSGWLLETLAQKQGRGRLHNVVVRNGRQETIGWFLYYGDPGAIGAVVQVGAREGYAGEVFDHLFHHARRQGLMAVSGKVDPAVFHVLAGKDCFFHHDGGSSMLVHSRNPELLHAIDRGDAFLTRLEGEWWISFLLS